MNNPSMDLDTPAIVGAAKSGAPAANQDTPAGEIVSAKVAAEKLQVSMLIGDGDLIEGRIKIQAGKSLVIRGVVNGVIECEGTVVILNGGKVLGEIRAAQLVNEGDIGEPKNPAKVDVGDLVLGVNSRVIGDCTYDTMAVNVPNRGVRGQMIPRSELEAA